MHRIIADNREAIAELCRRYGVARLEVFGSAARGSDFNAQSSDADFLVEYQRPAKLTALEEYFGLRESLASLLGRDIDLVEPGAIENPYLNKAINSSRELVYAA